MTVLKASNITLGEVHRLLGFQEQLDGAFTPLLSLEPIARAEEQELLGIRNDFRAYLIGKKASEGQVRLVAIAPLLRLAGFYSAPIELKVEEDVARIEIEDEDTTITGRFDIIAVKNNPSRRARVDLWILAIESKNSGVNSFQGMPQLLTYAYESLQHQDSVWGLTTNGMQYQFAYIQAGNLPSYQYMPLLNLLEMESAVKLLQVLKAIARL